MHKNIFYTLGALAEDVAPIKSSRMTAAIVRGKEIISFGANQMRTHPFQAKFGKNPESLFWHAETNAIFNALRVVDVDSLKKADLYVCRVKYSSTKREQFILGNAKPCMGCAKCIADFGVKRVFYTTETGYECL
jgi:deoxycytidylate deaminase